MLKEKIPAPESEDEKHLEEALEKIDMERLKEELGGVFGDNNREENIQKTVEAFVKMTVELRERADEYDAVLSEEATGRLISLVMRKVLNKELELEGKEKMPIYFVAAGSRADSGVHSFLEEHEGEFEKVLVVTEFIERGKSIDSFVKALEKNNIDYDIAALSASESFRLYENYSELSEKLIVGAEDSNLGLSVFYFDNERYAGVSRNSHFAPYKPQEPHPGKVDKKHADKVNEARHDVNLIAEELYKLLENENSQ